MNRNICLAAFAAGLLAIVWVGVGYAGSHPLALAMTAIIGAVYVAGALELQRFQRATDSLAAALGAIPANLASLGEWLDRLHPSLQNAVRLRVEGERVGLPGPAVAPYLVGLLVMLGMLGTFLGMVVTLNGAVLALETTTDLPTIRAALAAPVKGLGLAFGTSVAGVAASAMLGLISALCRRERLLVGRSLDAKIAGELRGFSLVHQRQETFKALQAQSRALPEVADGLAALMARLERQNAQLNERLLADQARFQSEASAAYGELARAVDRSLKESLGESARLAGAAIQPAVEATLAGLAREATALHERMAATAAARFDGLAASFGTTAGAVADTWNAALAGHERRSEALAGDLRQTLEGFAEGFERRSAALLAGVNDAHVALRSDLAAHDERRLAALAQSVEAMGASLRQEWQQAGEQSLAQQQAICRTLEATAQGIAEHAQGHASRTIDEIARLMQTAAEAPRIAAEAIGELRQQVAESVARDNELLVERGRIMEGLGALLGTVDAAAAEQRAAIASLAASAVAALDRAGDRVAEAADGQSATLAAAVAQVTGGAAEVASLAEAFAFAVQRFGETGDRLVGGLERIEGALGKSLARSDDQLAYYVAQARELIDLCVMSQQRVVGDLQRLQRHAALTAEAG
ncbi:MAG: DUF802 domain-containing protein [Rhodocyclaceae bacterium]|nr:DUF802 domain-containing protein [Rhodocyclaceae bacterium]